MKTTPVPQTDQESNDIFAIATTNQKDMSYGDYDIPMSDSGCSGIETFQITGLHKSRPNSEKVEIVQKDTSPNEPIHDGPKPNQILQYLFQQIPAPSYRPSAEITSQDNSAIKHLRVIRGETEPNPAMLLQPLTGRLHSAGRRKTEGIFGTVGGSNPNPFGIRNKGSRHRFKPNL